MEMMRHIKPLYVRAHLNGILVSKVLIDNAWINGKCDAIEDVKSSRKER